MYAYLVYIQLYMFAVNNFHKIYSTVAEKGLFCSQVLKHNTVIILFLAVYYITTKPISCKQ